MITNKEQIKEMSNFLEGKVEDELKKSASISFSDKEWKTIMNILGDYEEANEDNTKVRTQFNEVIGIGKKIDNYLKNRQGRVRLY